MDLENIDAPQFVDFTKDTEAEAGENVEDYFNFDHENGGQVVSSVSDSHENSFYLDAKDTTPEDTNKELRRSARNTPGSSEKKSNLQKPSNICTDLEAWRKKSKTMQKGNKNVKVDVSPSKKARRSAVVIREASQKEATVNKHSRTRSSDTRTSALRRSLRRSNSLKVAAPEKKTESARSSQKNAQESSNKAQMPKLAGTSTVLKKEMKFQHDSQPKSSEQLELEQIQNFKKSMALKRKTQEQFRQKALLGNKACKPVHSGMPLTKPEEFNFKTDSRLKSAPLSADRGDKGKDFVAQLRAHQSDVKTSEQQKAGPSMTVPKPFSFDRKRKADRTSKDGESEDKYETMAEKINKFTGTPERFRTRPGNKEPSPAKRRRRSISQPHMTFPKTPNLQTRGRSRPAHVKSQAEIDADELEEIKKYEFHAKPVNEKIMTNKCIGVKKIESKESTVPESFDLETNRRADAWRSKPSEKSEEYQFHAKPLPKAILDGPVGVKPAKSIPVTVPESPAFALKNRVRSSIQLPEVLPQEEGKATRAKPAPHFGLPYQPRFDHKVTECQPFSFEKRNKKLLEKKEQKIKKLVEEESKVPEFHANPIPDLSPVLPPKQTIPPTVPKPFALEVEERGAQKAQEWSCKIKDELKKQREKANFKAKPNKVVTAKPFIPEISRKPLTAFEDFALNTDARAQQREQWEQWKHEKEVEEQEVRHAHDTQLQQQQQKEMERLRKERVPKAQPIKKYKDVVVRPSEKELTRPHTPRFSERLKSRVDRL